jgi:hypothetical protein
MVTTPTKALKSAPGAKLLSTYSFLHYNYQYDWLRPTLEEIMTAYKKLYGPGHRDSDSSSASSSDSESDQADQRRDGRG